MGIFLRAGFILLIFFHLFLASWYVRQGDIIFSPDIARDFHLLREIDEKKLVLIGPRSSTGLFHGPLWLYLNYPAYALGRGNPVVVGWFWVVLVALFAVECFWVGRKLFSPATGYLFALWGSLYLAYHANGMYNPHGALVILPLVFFFFVRFWETGKTRYLLFQWFTTGLLVQFQMAIGIPFLILSVVAVFFRSLRRKHYQPLALLPLILLIFSNFIIFDLRHELLLTRKLGDFLSPVQNGIPYNYFSFVPERIRLMISAVEILRVDAGYRNFFLSMVVLLFIIWQLRAKKFVVAYRSFLYFYVGFFLLSLINKGPLIYFYLFPLFPLVFLIFASMVTNIKRRLLFLPLFLAIYAINLNSAVHDARVAKYAIGTSIYSWKFLHELAKSVYDQAPQTFGYFVYSPDVFAYEGKYAMRYASTFSGNVGKRTTKAPTTYLIIAPPPPLNPYMKDEWWRKNQVRISALPAATRSYPNGYKVETYRLSPADIAASFDPAIDPGIHFR